MQYYTGQVFDMAKIAHAAHSVGAYAGFDLAHAAGNIVLKLHDWDIDYACWCSYKVGTNVLVMSVLVIWIYFGCVR